MTSGWDATCSNDRGFASYKLGLDEILTSKREILREVNVSATGFANHLDQRSLGSF